MAASRVLGDVLRGATDTLTKAGCDSPRLDAEVLLAYVLGCSRSKLHVRWRDGLDDAQVGAFQSLVDRRTLREPVAYLVGERAFYDVDLYVTPAVLIPRPETEHTVELALSWAKVWRLAHRSQILRVVDVGTGSGALAVVLARHLPYATVNAVDISPEALVVAEKNVAKYHLADRVVLVHGDLLDPVDSEADLVVANLPYVRREEIAMLDADVAHYEPHLALDGGVDGLDLVRRLATQLAVKLAKPGLALLEIDPRQVEQTVAIMRAALPGASVGVHKDLAGWDRVVSVERSAILAIKGK